MAVLIRNEYEIGGISTSYKGANPIGTIISFMGTIAPQDYLICDGALYNIADFPELAQHILTQFGRYNYFGGNGTTTFAVPNLQGEFLRGAGANSHENQGSGSAVGAHQDATEIPSFGATNTANGAMWFNGLSDGGYTTFTKNDSYINNGNHGKGKNITNVVEYNSSINYTHFATRPTNTSVLYCIKYI